VYQASKLYQVPRSSLQNIVDRKATLGNTKFGPKPALGDHEPLLVHWIEAMSKRGFPITTQNLLVSVGKIAKEMGVDQLFNGNPGKKWFKLFMKRNPSIAKRTVEKVTKSRSLVTKTHILNWFNNVQDFLIENNLMDILENPSRIFNTDESGFMLCPKGEKVLSMRGEKNVYEVCGNNDKQQITVLVNISADGVVAPTMLVFSGKRMPKGIAKTIPSDWSMAVSDKGWITGETFFEYVANVFYPWLIEKKIQLPVILFLDGHVSHLTYHLSMFCKDKGIHIIAFYPNSTHIQQPLDVAIFGPLKKEWAKEVHDWRMKSEDSLTKYDFAPLLNQVINTRLTKETVKNGFRTTGLFPWDSSAIDYSKCITKEVENEVELVVEPVTTVDRTKDNIRGHEYLESLIEPNVIAEFKNNINEVWNGLEQGSAINLYGGPNI